MKRKKQIRHKTNQKNARRKKASTERRRHVRHNDRQKKAAQRNPHRIDNSEYIEAVADGNAFDESPTKDTE